MGRFPEQTESEIDRQLAATLSPDSPNGITAAELRKGAVEYLRENDEEVARFPHLAGDPHWNLWMRDAHFGDALFAVLVFRHGGVEFFCGTGEAFAIKQFAECEIIGDVEQVSVELARRFSIPEGVLHLSGEEAEAWLGRGW